MWFRRHCKTWYLAENFFVGFFWYTFIIERCRVSQPSTFKSRQNTSLEGAQSSSQVVSALLNLKRERGSFLDQKYTIEIKIRNFITLCSRALKCYILTRSDEWKKETKLIATRLGHSILNDYRKHEVQTLPYRTWFLLGVQGYPDYRRIR